MLKKVKAVPLCHAGAKGKRKYSSYSFLTSILDGVSGQHHALATLYPWERALSTQCTGGWVGLTAGLDTVARGKILCLCLGLNLGRPVCSQTLD
jgi:hypothetical protein